MGYQCLLPNINYSIYPRTFCLNNVSSLDFQDCNQKKIVNCIACVTNEMCGFFCVADDCICEVIEKDIVMIILHT